MRHPEAQDPLARWLRPPSSEDGEIPATPGDLSSRVMARLPQGSPAFHRAVAALVLEAWEDEALREQLRRDPVAALATWGLAPPEGTDVTIVPPTEATLPSGHRWVLPIGDPRPSVSSDRTTPLTAAEAHALLSRTEWRWLLLSQEEIHAESSALAEGAFALSSAAPRPSEPSPRSETSPVRTTQPTRDAAPWWRRLVPRAAAPVWALAGAVGVLALLVWGTAGEGLLSTLLGAGSGSTSGTAMGAPPWIWLSSAVVVVVALIWWSGRRGG